MSTVRTWVFDELIDIVDFAAVWPSTKHVEHALPVQTTGHGAVPLSDLDTKPAE